MLGPLLFYLCCLVGDQTREWIGGSGITLHIIYQDRIQAWTYRLNEARAEAYLNDLLSDLLDRSMTEWLPFHVVTGSGRSVRPHLFRAGRIDDLFVSGLNWKWKRPLKIFFSSGEDYLIHLAAPTISADAFDRSPQTV